MQTSSFIKNDSGVSVLVSRLTALSRTRRSFDGPTALFLVEIVTDYHSPYITPLNEFPVFHLLIGRRVVGNQPSLFDARPYLVYPFAHINPLD